MLLVMALAFRRLKVCYADCPQRPQLSAGSSGEGRMEDKERYWDCLDQAMDASHSGRSDEALSWLDEALKANPHGAEAHNGRGEILWESGQVDEARFEFEQAALADPKFVTGHLNRVELLIEGFGEHEQALAECDRLLSGTGELPRLDRGMEAELYYLKAKSLFYLDDLEGALFLVRRGLQRGGEQGVYRSFAGQLLFELGRFDEAKSELERAHILDPDSAHAIYHYALVCERLGESERVADAFAKADALEPEQYPLPVHFSIDRFQLAAKTALRNLPRSIHEYVEHVPILVEDFPSLDLIQNEHVSPQILGVFMGVPSGEESLSEHRYDLDRLVLFKKNLEKSCRDEDELIDQIQFTVKHEIGHYLGLDEDDLERLGLA